MEKMGNWDLSSLLLLLVAAAFCSVNGAGEEYISAVGDPGMKRDRLRVALEAWNFCNEVGHEVPGIGSPRVADCFDVERISDPSVQQVLRETAQTFGEFNEIYPKYLAFGVQIQNSVRPLAIEMEEPVSKGSTKRIAVVTGANKGIGFEICRQLSSRGVLVVVTARDERRGTEAVEKLKSFGLSDVLFHQLDVADPSSVSSLANFVKTQFGKLDILVNNAGAGGLEIDPHGMVALNQVTDEEDGLPRLMKIGELGRETNEKAVGCLNVNYYGARRATEALMPLLQLAQSPNIVNVSSRYGRLKNIPGEIIRKQMGTVDEQTEERLDELLKSFLKDFNERKLEENGWPTSTPTHKVSSAYIVSKVAVSTYTRFLAEKFPKIRINCVHPGFVNTDINFNTGNLTVEEGAKGPVMLALLPVGSPTGLFYEQTNPSTFE